MQVLGPSVAGAAAASSVTAAARAPGQRAMAAALGGPTSPATLWDLLTPEERDYFTQLAALGPLSYRPGGAPGTDAPSPLGGRLDVQG